MKRPVWRAAGAAAQSVPRDPAPLFLAQIARHVSLQAGTVLRGRVRGDCMAAERTLAPASFSSRRIWHCESALGNVGWCLVDERASRALLELILGGPAAPVQTSLERSILGEALVRLLSGDGLAWHETNEPPPPTAHVWVAEMVLEPANAPAITFTLCTPAAPEPAPRPRTRIEPARIPIAVTAIVSPVFKPIASLAALRPGSVVEFDASAQPAVRLVAGSNTIGHGTLGALRGKRAIRLSQAAPNDQRTS